ncbi:peptidoglycan recognition protein family protein [Clostridium algidicarnis]|uniref:peptidoglycan recognition protein family protein n=1 Tax=Clostridium algidicarnis TaxID=37659 RepID=UPI0016247251|nr:peptidoglycan recognition family protein [Clostridium algidicarnis]MBB6696237.1 N-acetylmuramoyl-L-alanine amidase [Clostridium algidicarnis]
MKINEVYLKGQEEAAGSNNPNKIIIHHPEWYGDIVGLNNIMRNMGYYMIGYNYYVRKDGSVWKGRPDWATGANCYGQNTQSIGVCFEGNFEKDKEMPKEQFNSGVELIQYLKNKYGISEVGGHKKYYNTACPGKNFPLNDLINSANGSAATQNIILESSAPAPTKSNFSYSNNAKITRDFLYVRDSMGSIIPGRRVDIGDNITVLDVGYTKQLVLVEYPTPSGVKRGYVTNATNCIEYYYQDEYSNGSTKETVSYENGSYLGSLDPYEKATPLYRKDGRLHVVYGTDKGSNTKSGYVVYDGGFDEF